MNSTFKIVNSIRGKALQRRLFKLKSNNDEEKELLLYNNVRWLSRSKFLERFLLLIDDVRNFVCQKGDHYSELSDKKWLLDLSFLVDFCKKLNDLNLELQGKNKNLIDMISSIRSFQQLLILLKDNLNNREYQHFPYLLRFLNDNAEMRSYDFTKFINEIEIVENEINLRFADFNEIEGISSFVNNPFQQNLNISEISKKISTLFDTDQPQIELEIINIKNNIYLKSINGENIWKFTYEKFPILTNIVQKILACFGSTYLSESAFSSMNIIKNKLRNQITNDHLDQCLRLATSSYEPDYESIAKSRQNQVSH